MVDGVLQPLNIFLLGLGGGFLMPLLHKIGRPLPAIAFVAALVTMTVISATCFWRLYNGAPTIEVLTAGNLPPLSINLRFGLAEGFFSLCVNVAALLGAWHMWDRLRASYTALLLYLILTMGINGMVMTRDLFNLFVFLEIVSIGTYGLMGLDRTPAALAASLKYIMATVIASSFFLLGSALLYHVTGTLNIDDMIANRELISGPIGTTALLLVLACLVVELKPFPANGWGLDVYETAHSGVAALISAGVSAGVFFALFKLLPLFENHLGMLALSGGVTFLLSNLVGLRQTSVQRMLGYSSIAQMGLLTLALSLMQQLGAQETLPLVVGGLFTNHLFAKAGLFWLAGVVARKDSVGWSDIAGRPLILAVFAALLVAISGLPPFPGFWAKWELIMQLALGGRYVWITVILAGSLLEAAYMFQWFKHAMRRAPDGTDDAPLMPGIGELVPVLVCVVLLAASGYAAASLSTAASLFLFLPLFLGGGLYVFDGFAGRVKCLLMVLLVYLGTRWSAHDLVGINALFAAVLLTGGLIIASSGAYRPDRRPGFYPIMTILLLSIASLMGAATSLEFFYHWEIIGLSSYFLIAQGRGPHTYALQFLLFSLASAFCIIAGFGIATAVNGTTALAAFKMAGPDAAPAFVLLAAGFLIKCAAIGVHIWLPNAHAEADGDLSAMLSGVISKVAVFGLFMTTFIAIRSEAGLEMAHALGWIGLLTTLAGALMAFQQTDMKRMLAYSSISQIGYIITAIALMSHLGWVTAFYLVANHLMVKGILFLAAAGIILRTGMRQLDIGGLAPRMPFTFALVVLALISMSGLPPLAGFGGKWLLLSAMVDKGWYGLVALTVVATLLGFLYMFRFAQGIFLGPGGAEHDHVREAPLALLLPQFVLLAGILTLSFFPKLFMAPVSAAIDPHFASTLVWQGMSLETIYSTWNPLPVIGVTVAATCILFALAFLVYRAGGDGPASRGIPRFYRFYQSAFTPLVTPLATAFWGGVCDLTVGAGGLVRRIYTGNGQTYALYVFYYVIALYLFGTFGSVSG